MRFTVLGSGTGLPDPTRGPAGFLLQAAGRAFLVDGGSGTLQRCAAAGVDPRTLDGGIYSHRHPDHCADLVPLLFAMHIPPERPVDYPIWAGEGFAAYLQGLRDLYGRWIDFAQAGAVVTELSLAEPDEADLGGIRLRTRPANHGAGALHLRFEADGCAVVFSGDTGPSDALVELATGADLLVCECALPDDAPVQGHLTPSAVAEIVDAAQPKAVWLTHFYPSTDPQRATALVARTGIPTHRPGDLDRWGGGVRH